MPRLLKKEAAELLEGSIECYSLALMGGLLNSLRTDVSESARFAPVIGLIGSSFELLCKSILVQSKGKRSVTYKDGRYKYGNEIIDTISSLVRARDSSLEFLCPEKDKCEAIFRKIDGLLKKARLVSSRRADGLHAGRGPSEDSTNIIMGDLFSLFTVVGSCRKYSKSLKKLPCPKAPRISREALLEDLTGRLIDETAGGAEAGTLKDLFLVMPYIPEFEPEWLKLFDRISVTPRRKDLSYLIENFGQVKGIFLHKASGGKDPLPVVIDEKSKLRVGIESIKRQFLEVPTQFHSDVGNANARFEEGYLNLIPREFLMQLFCLGLKESRIITEDFPHLTAQQTWPFIISAMAHPGTPSPYLFLLYNCCSNELTKLLYFIAEAKKIGGKRLKKRALELEEATEAKLQGNNYKSDLLTDEAEKIERRSEGATRWLSSIDEETIQSHTDIDPQLLRILSIESMQPNTALERFLNKPQESRDYFYWLGKILPGIIDYESRKHIFQCYRWIESVTKRNKDLSNAGNMLLTESRKLLRYMDYKRFA